MTSAFPRSDPAATLGRSLGSAVGFMRRLVPFGLDEEADEPVVESKTAPPPVFSGMAARSRPAAPSGRLRTLENRHRALEREISRLEKEVERLHTDITRGSPRASRRDRSGRQHLDDLLEQTRQVRDQLQDKRDELVRLERHIARERRLGARPDETKEVEAKPRVPRKRAKLGLRPITDRARERRLRNALKRGSFEGRSERLTFERMAEGLLSDDPDVRRDTVRQIALIDDEANEALLLLAGEDSDQRVCLEAIKALSSFESPAAIRTVRGHLHSRSTPLRVAALRGLASMNVESGVADFVAALEDDEPAVRKAAAVILGWRRDSASVPPLLVVLRDHDQTVRAAAAGALASCGSHRAVFSLIHLLDDESNEVRRAGFRGLRGIVGREIDEVGAGLDGRERIAALVDWWKKVRADKALGPEADVDAEAYDDFLDEGGAGLEDSVAEEASPKEATPAGAAAPAEAAPEAAEKPDEAAASPAPDGGDVAEGLESVIGGDEDEGGEELVLGDEEAGGDDIALPGTDEADGEEGFESFGIGEDEGEDAEEFENVLGGDE